MEEKTQSLEETSVAMTAKEVEENLRQTRATIDRFKAKGVKGNHMERLIADEKALSKLLEELKSESR